MSYPRRDPRDGGSPLDSLPSGEDLAPTGEHMPADLMELSGSDLEVDEERDGPTVAATPRGISAGLGRSGPMPITHQPSPLFPDEDGVDPLAMTMSPEAIPTDPAGGAEDGVAASFAPDTDPITDDEGLEPLDNAPTRIEREEEIRASFESTVQHGARLLIIGGNNRGKEYSLKLRDNSIGRGVDNDIILADIAVSRKHTLVCYEGTDFVVRDLGSGNGTLLNGARVDAQALRDGDQMELGNTLLRFVHPEALVSEPADPGALASMATVVTPQGAIDSDMGRATADILPAAVVPRDTVKERRGKRKLLATRRQKLLVFGGIGVLLLLGLMVGLKLVMTSKKKAQATAQQAAQPSLPPDELAAQEFQEGIAQYRIRSWENARVHFLKVVKLVPSADHAKRYVDQATAEIDSRDALQRAKNALGAKDFQTARKELVRIPSTSAYAPEAQQLKQRVDGEQLSKLLAAAKTLKAADDIDGARAKLKEAMAIEPTDPEVVRLSAALSDEGGPARARPPRGRSSKRHVRRSKPSKPSKPSRASGNGTIRVRGGKFKGVLSLYKQKQWGQAHKAAQQLTEKSRGRAKKSAKTLTQAIYRVGMAWNRAKKSSTDTARVKYYQEALRHDRKIQRGVHQATLKKLLIQSAKAATARAIAQRRYATAARAIKIAERHGAAGDPTLQRAKQVLEKKAMDMFTKGYTIRSTNVAHARRLWQQVLKLVPPASPAYQRAYQWLNNSSPSYQDEDED